MKKLNKIQIGERIRKQREYLGYTRVSLAEKIGLTDTSLRSVEIGARGLSMETLISLSEHLMVSTDYILKGENTANSELEPIFEMLLACRKDKLKFVAKLLVVFLSALD